MFVCGVGVVCLCVGVEFLCGVGVCFPPNTWSNTGRGRVPKVKAFAFTCKNGPHGPRRANCSRWKGCRLLAPTPATQPPRGAPESSSSRTRQAGPLPLWRRPQTVSVGFSSDTAKSMATPVLPTRGHCKAGTVGPHRVVSIPHCGPTQGISPPRRR